MHSAPATVTPDSESPPEQPGTRPEPPGGKGEDDKARPAWLRGWMVIVASAVSVVLVAILFTANRSKTPASSATSISGSANPNQILRLKGTTEAVQARDPRAAAGGPDRSHPHDHSPDAGRDAGQERRSAGGI